MAGGTSTSHGSNHIMNSSTGGGNGINGIIPTYSNIINNNI